jgi:hypothetical protein
METDMLYEHVDTAVIDGDSLPWVPFAPYAENVLLKYFKLDPIRGEWIVLMKSPIDMQLPKHHHTGTGLHDRRQVEIQGSRLDRRTRQRRVRDRRVDPHA